jgi:hypothetical protein
VDIPVKLPAPDAGTDAQPGPKSVLTDAADAGAAGAEPASELMGADGEDAAPAAEPLELHAAALMAMPATSPEMAS